MSVLKVITKLFRSTTVPITAPATALSGPSSPPPEPAPRLLPSGNTYRPFQSVESYDLKTGTIIAEFTNRDALYAAGYDPVRVLQVAKGRRRRYKQMGWRWCNQSTAIPIAALRPLTGKIPARQFRPRHAQRVAAISPITGEIARIYPTLTAVSIDGFQPTMVSKAIKGIYQQSGGYLWKTVETKPDDNTIQDSRIRPLEAVNPVTGEVQERYEGLFAAVKEGYVSAGIRAAIANGWKHHGLVWRYADNQPTTPRAVIEPQSRGTPVESYDPATGRTLKVYRSVSATAQDDYQPELVRKVVQGATKRHKGVGWRYCDPASSAQLSDPSKAPTFPSIDPQTDVAVLTEAQRRSELKRLCDAVFFDENREQWGVRLPDGRILHRPARSAVVNLWYEEERRRRQSEPSAADAERPTVPPAAGVAAPPKQRLSHTKFARIEAFDPETGGATRTFDGIQSAVRQGFSRTSVYSALKGKLKTYKGYGWRVNTTLTNPIEARCPATGSVVFVFHTIEDVRARGYTIYGVNEAIEHGGTYKHLHWGYADSRGTAPGTSIEKVAQCNS